jgi:hypothetical protein
VLALGVPAALVRAVRAADQKDPPGHGAPE